MTSQVPTNAIVVGVDGSAQGWNALRWAADRADRSGRPLHIMHAVGAHMSIYDLAPNREPMDNVTDEAVGVVARHHPNLPVTWSQPGDAPAAALVEVSSVAAEIVLGTKGMGAVRGAVLGSVTTQVSAAAHCPVLVVRDVAKERAARGPVVVGVDPRPDGVAALDFAFAEAARMKVPLVAILCWQLDRWDFASGIPMPGGDLKATRQYHREQLQQVLTGPAEQHPGVKVVMRVECAPTAATLVEASHNASLLVVGTRGHHELVGLVLGSVSQSVIRHATCPVAVVTHAVIDHAATSAKSHTPV